MKQITITVRQAEQFNSMLTALRMIAGSKTEPTSYMTSEQLRKSDEAKFIGFEDVVEMAYENIQGLAKQTANGVRPIVF